MLCSPMTSEDLQAQLQAMRTLLDSQSERLATDLQQLSARVRALEEAAVVPSRPPAPPEPEAAAPPSKLPEDPALEADAPAEAEHCKVDVGDSVVLSSSQQVLTDKLDQPEYYTFQASMWDVQLFIGRFLTPADSFMVVIYAVLNFMVQIFFVIIVWLMTPETLTNQSLEDFTHWRFSEGHRWSNYDYLTNTSLVRRVCDNFGANVVATSQQTWTANFNSYLPPDMSFHTGAWLCALSVLLWSMTLLIDIWNTESFAVAVVSMVKDYHGATIVENADDKIRVVNISFRRCVYALTLIVLPRVGIDIGLLFGGIRFLVYEMSLSGLILNAVALGFILGLDELVFQLLPSRAQRIVDVVEPVLKHKLFVAKKTHLDKRSLTILLGCVSVVLYAWFVFIGPKVDIIEEGRRILCGDNTDFVFTMDPVTGAVSAAPTSPNLEMRDVHTVLAVMQRSGLRPEGHLGKFARLLPGEGLTSTVNIHELQEIDVRTMFSSLQEMECKDHDDSLTSARALHSIYWGGFGAEADPGSFCSSVIHLCGSREHGTFLRLVCAETCQCASASLYDRSGCGQKCSELVQSRVAAAAGLCADTNDRLGDLEGLYRFLRSLHAHLLESGKLRTTIDGDGNFRTSLSPAQRQSFMQRMSYTHAVVDDSPIFRFMWDTNSWLLATPSDTELCQWVPLINSLFDIDVCSSSPSSGTIRGFCPLSCHVPECDAYLQDDLPPQNIDPERLPELQRELHFEGAQALFVPMLRCGVPQRVRYQEPFVFERPAWGNGTYVLDWCNSSVDLALISALFYRTGGSEAPVEPPSTPPACSVAAQLLLGEPAMAVVGHVNASALLHGLPDLEVMMVCHNDGEIACGDTVSGSTVGAFHQHGGPATERTYYVTADRGMTVDFDACGSELDVELSLYRTEGVFQAKGNASLVPTQDSLGACGDRRRLTFEIPEDSYRYLLVVEGAGVAQGSFSVHMDCFFPTIRCGDMMVGSTAGLGSKYGSPAPEVIWTFETGPGGNFTFDTCGTPFDSDLRLFDRNMTQVAYQDYWNMTLCSWQARLTVNLPANAEYYLLLEGYNQAQYGDYTLQVLCDV